MSSAQIPDKPVEFTLSQWAAKDVDVKYTKVSKDGKFTVNAASTKGKDTVKAVFEKVNKQIKEMPSPEPEVLTQVLEKCRAMLQRTESRISEKADGKKISFFKAWGLSKAQSEFQNIEKTIAARLSEKVTTALMSDAGKNIEISREGTEYSFGYQGNLVRVRMQADGKISGTITLPEDEPEDEQVKARTSVYDEEPEPASYVEYEDATHVQEDEETIIELSPQDAKKIFNLVKPKPSVEETEKPKSKTKEDPTKEMSDVIKKLIKENLSDFQEARTSKIFVHPDGRALFFNKDKTKVKIIPGAEGQAKTITIKAPTELRQLVYPEPKLMKMDVRNAAMAAMTLLASTEVRGGPVISPEKTFEFETDDGRKWSAFRDGKTIGFLQIDEEHTVVAEAFGKAGPHYFSEDESRELLELNILEDQSKTEAIEADQTLPADYRLLKPDASIKRMIKTDFEGFKGSKTTQNFRIAENGRITFKSAKRGEFTWTLAEKSLKKEEAEAVRKIAFPDDVEIRDSVYAAALKKVGQLRSSAPPDKEVFIDITSTDGRKWRIFKKDEENFQFQQIDPKGRPTAEAWSTGDWRTKDWTKDSVLGSDRAEVPDDALVDFDLFQNENLQELGKYLKFPEIEVPKKESLPPQSE
jgi:hypothetical protein